MTETQPSTALTPVDISGAVTDLDGAMRLSKTLAFAAIMPDALRGKPADVLAIMLYGQDLGLSPMQAIQGIDIIKGKPRISAKLMVAKARQAGHLVTIKEHTGSSCTVEAVRKDTGERHQVTFTSEDAAKARLCSIKDGQVIARSSKGEPLPWETRHRTMLQWRAAQECLNFLCPEITFGFDLEGDFQVNDAGIVVPDEADDFTPEDDQIQDAEIVDDETAAADLAEMAAQYDFAQPAECGECGLNGGDHDEECRSRGRFPCEACGPEAHHFEDECPNRVDA